MELIVDNFAGGGGASTGIELALRRPVDIAINHDPIAVALHQANHPKTHHCCEDVFKIDPAAITHQRPVGLAWFSPDCKHFSKAKGGKPRSKKIRGLAWVVIKWAVLTRPRIVILENVEEFQDWGPLLPSGQPCPIRKGRTFKSFIKRLHSLGYQVDWRELRACDYGAPTIRKRLFLIARCDGKPITWPAATHGDPSVEGFAASGLQPWRTAAECIDWSLPCPSIFLTRRNARQLRKVGIKIQRPLAKATMRRIAKGVVKFVLRAKEPFIVSLTHQGGDRVEPVSEPVRVITGAHRGEKAIVLPFVTEHANASHQRNFPIDSPLRTICAEVKGGHFALVAAFLAKYHSANRPGGDRVAVLGEPLRTQDTSNRFALIASHLTKFYGTNIGHAPAEPLHSITAQGNHIGLVAAFLQKYYGTGGQDQQASDPLHTIPTVDRFGLVTVDIAEETLALADIGMRMLIARELYRAQGFPESYIIDIEVNALRCRKWKRVPLSNEAKVYMCGNSVCPPVAEAIVTANCSDLSL